MADDLGLDKADALIMDIKSKLYKQAASAINKSKDTHAKIAEKIGTSRARITRISNMGENSISIDLLIKIIFTLENKIPFHIAAWK